MVRSTWHLWTPIRQCQLQVERGDVMNDKLLYRITEVAHYLSLSRSKVYELVRAGVLPSIKIDGVRRIRGVDVLEFVDGLRRVA